MNDGRRISAYGEGKFALEEDCLHSVPNVFRDEEVKKRQRDLSRVRALEAGHGTAAHWRAHGISGMRHTGFHYYLCCLQIPVPCFVIFPIFDSD